MANTSVIYQLNGTELVIMAGDVLTLPVEGLTCYSSTSLTLRSALGSRLIEQGGGCIKHASIKQAPTQVGDAVVLPTGRLAAKYLLAAVTNEPHAVPVLMDVRASIGAVIRRSDNLKLSSLAVPLLRVKRKYTQENMLFITLAPLLDHLCGATTLRRVFLVVNEESLSPLLMRRLPRLLDVLVELSKQRAIADAFRDIERTMEGLSAISNWPVWEEVLRAQLAQQQHVLESLHHAFELLDQDWSASLDVEINRCVDEITRISHMLVPLASRIFVNRGEHVQYVGG